MTKWHSLLSFKGFPEAKSGVVLVVMMSSSSLVTRNIYDDRKNKMSSQSYKSHPFSVKIALLSP